MHTKSPLTLLLLLLIISTFATPAPPPSQPTTTTTTITTAHPHPTPTPQPPPPPLLPKRCRPCPKNNTLGLTCYKNIFCIPLSLLCTPLTNTASPPSSSSSCPDLSSFQIPGAGAGATPTSSPEPGSVTCNADTFLCQDPTFLPLPVPGVGSIRRDSTSSTSCLRGAFFSLYPSLLSSFSSSTGSEGAGEGEGGGGNGGGGSSVQQKYIQSCIVSTPFPSNSNNNNNNVGGQAPCQEWEYRVGDSCLLRLCGGPPSSQELSCVLPYTCRKPSPSPSSPDTSSSYGVCSNSSHPNPDDFDPTTSPTHFPPSQPSARSKKELLLFNLLIALCSLVGITALLIIIHHLRKRHLQRQGRYLAWTRQDKIHFLQALICRREMGQLWEEREKRLRVLQERELKWKPTGTAGGQRRDGSGSAAGNGSGGDSQESVAMYDLHPETTTTTTATQPRSMRAPLQQQQPSSLTAPTTTAPTLTATIQPTMSPPLHLLPNTTLAADSSSSNDDNLRPISHTDSESTDTSSQAMMTHQSRRHRSVLDIFARRWQQQQLQLQQEQQLQQLQGGQDRVREQPEPPPLYHQGPDLPAYRIHSLEPESSSGHVPASGTRNINTNRIRTQPQEDD